MMALSILAFVWATAKTNQPGKMVPLIHRKAVSMTPSIDGKIYPNRINFIDRKIENKLSSINEDQNIVDIDIESNLLNSNDDHTSVEIIYEHCNMCRPKHTTIATSMWRVKASIIALNPNKSNMHIDKARLLKLFEILGKDIMVAILLHSSLNLSMQILQSEREAMAI